MCYIYSRRENIQELHWIETPPFLGSGACQQNPAAGQIGNKTSLSQMFYSVYVEEVAPVDGFGGSGKTYELSVIHTQ